jgi:hypothetical protein
MYLSLVLNNAVAHHHRKHLGFLLSLCGNIKKMLIGSCESGNMLFFENWLEVYENQQYGKYKIIRQ